jgi:hypothetical protein
MTIHDLNTAIAVLENHTNEMRTLLFLEGKSQDQIDELLRPHLVRISELKQEVDINNMRNQSGTITFND